MNKKGNILNQIFEVLEFECNLKLSNLSNASFKLDINTANRYADILSPFNKIKICENKAGKEKTFISGFISRIKTDFNSVTVDVSSELNLLQNRIISEEKKFNNTSIKNILEEVFSLINQTEDTKIKINCETEENINIEFKAGNNIYNILLELAKKGYEFKLENGILYFGKQVGKDLSAGIGNEQISFEYDIRVPEHQSIISAKSVVDSKEIHNVLFGEDKVLEDEKSIEKYGRIEKVFSSLSGENISDYLEKHKEKSLQYEIIPKVDNFFLVNLGDIVKTKIFTGNKFLNINAPMKVLEKKFKSSANPRITIKLSNTSVKSVSFEDLLQKFFSEK